MTSETTYTGKDALFEAPSYSYYVLSETPSFYKELTADEDDSLSFSKVEGTSTKLEDASATVTTVTNYGDYQINVTGLPEDIGTVYGVLLTTVDSEGNTANYGLRHVENIWRNSNLAWSVGHTTTVHGSTVSYEPYASSEGQTITKITYYTDAGVYTIDCSLTLSPYYDGEVTAAAASASVVALTGLPDDIEDATAVVYYTEGSGRDAETIYLTDEAGVSIESGSVTLTTAMPNNTECTVRIDSDNYATMTATVTYTAPTVPSSSATSQGAATVADPVFTDVGTDSYCYDAVAWAVEQGIVSGAASATFAPNSSCTRAQAVTFLWRAAGSPAPKSSVNPFTDVAPGAYYYNAVLWAAEQGITTGVTATTFSPDAPCTRAQAVTFLWRAAGSPAAKRSVNPFTDVASGAYYRSAVLWAVEQGITTGTTVTTFSPNANCLRGQIVTFLYRADN